MEVRVNGIALARWLIAEYFADLSAQAMTGGLAKLDLAKQNVVVPEVKPIVAAPINVQLQKEMIKKYTSINSWARLLK